MNMNDTAKKPNVATAMAELLSSLPAIRQDIEASPLELEIKLLLSMAYCLGERQGAIRAAGILGGVYGMERDAL